MEPEEKQHEDFIAVMLLGKKCSLKKFGVPNGSKKSLMRNKKKPHPKELTFQKPVCCPFTGPIITQKKRRAATARRQHLKSAMLQLAVTEIEKEAAAKEVEKQNYLAEHCPPLSLPGSMQELQELCKKLHAKIESVDEERYDTEVKLQKTTKELEDLSQKLFDLRGKFKRPPLRRVRMSADAMLRALLGSKHKVCMDLRANLKQVKKEDTEKEKDLRDVGDWRKNIEEKSGMEGRKKMFEAGES
ncbi:troponin I, fast skeletal muscle [Melozone crissalis]|uniref:troponin I, fast skeletal muscle n=1 Tax=Melozone crissalis TaxID=40204 RepID=UPI0023DBCDFD|nr:troponin I, fast skeletal muscle [Melozone crissalis]